MDNENKELIFAGQVLGGENRACKKFIDDYSDLVLSKVWKLMKSHCRNSSKDVACILLVLYKQKKENRKNVGNLLN